MPTEIPSSIQKPAFRMRDRSRRRHGGEPDQDRRRRPAFVQPLPGAETRERRSGHAGERSITSASGAGQNSTSTGKASFLSASKARVAALLGKEAATWFPSGTMAQQIALRIHSDRRGRKAVAFHPHCHLDVHEERGYAVLHGLHAVLLGSRDRLFTLADLEQVARAARRGARRAPAARPRRAVAVVGRARRDHASWRGRRARRCTWTARASGSAAPSTAESSRRSPRCSTRSTSRSTRIWAPARAACSPGRRTSSPSRRSGGCATAAGCSGSATTSRRLTAASTRCCPGCRSWWRAHGSSRNRSQSRASR